jgi:membrane associated rhomboid family serine protease
LKSAPAISPRGGGEAAGIPGKSRIFPGTGLGDTAVVITTTLAILILAGFGVYVMTPEERGRILDAVRGVVLRVIDALKDTPASQPFNDFLRARTHRTVVTPLLIALNSVVFVFMLAGSGSVSDQQTLVNWGANFAPRTTNGEWWRLLSAMVVHAGFIHLLVTIASLVSLGFVLERAIGPYPFAAVYFAAGILANVVNLWTAPALSASAGGAGAIFGIYGLLLATLTWTIVGRPDGSIPLQMVKRIGSAAAIFFLYNWLTGHLGTTSELAGLTAGVVGGLVVSRGIVREKPRVERAVFVMAGAVVVAALCVVPVRGTVDVRSEIESVIAVEQRPVPMMRQWRSSDGARSAPRRSPR